MTAPSIISDQKAAEIVGRLDGHAVGGVDCDPRSKFGHFAATGKITASLVEVAEDAAEPKRLPGESDALWERRRQRWDLYLYVRHHGERGPVSGWSA